jgi:hypothetical protein
MSILSIKRDLEGETQQAEKALFIAVCGENVIKVIWTYGYEKVHDKRVDDPDYDEPLECKTVFEMCSIYACCIMYHRYQELYAQVS